MVCEQDVKVIVMLGGLKNIKVQQENNYKG